MTPNPLQSVQSVKPELLGQKSVVTLGLDVSSYQDADLDWTTLKAHGFEFVIVRLGDGSWKDPRAAAHLAGARAAGFTAFGGYQYDEYEVNNRTQANILFNGADHFQLHFLANDIERYKQTLTQAYTAAYISARAKDLTGMVSAAHYKILNYTSQDFVAEHALPMAAWLKNNPLWVAYWPDWGDVRHRVTWDELDQCVDRLASPLLPPGCPSWLFWQWTSRLVLPCARPGSWDAYDLDVFNGSLADLKAYCS